MRKNPHGRILTGEPKEQHLYLALLIKTGFFISLLRSWILSDWMQLVTYEKPSFDKSINYLNMHAKNILDLYIGISDNIIVNEHFYFYIGSISM